MAKAAFEAKKYQERLLEENILKKRMQAVMKMKIKLGKVVKLLKDKENMNNKKNRRKSVKRSNSYEKVASEIIFEDPRKIVSPSAKKGATFDLLSKFLEEEN